MSERDFGKNKYPCGKISNDVHSVGSDYETMAFLFNATRLLANWTVSDGNRTWIACDEGSSNTVAGWEQVRFLEKNTSRRLLWWLPVFCVTVYPLPSNFHNPTPSPR